MTWQVRHEGSPKVVQGLSLNQIVEGLRDGGWSPTDEVKGPQDSRWTPFENHPQFIELIEDLEVPSSPKHDDETRLDMNALIDVTLVLLIFFIITTTHMVAVQKIVPLPTITDAKKGTRKFHVSHVQKYMIRLQVVAEENDAPKMYLENKAVEAWDAKRKRIDKNKLKDLLKPLVTGDPPKRELLLDARNVSWGTVIAIQDTAKAAGVRIVHHLHRPVGN